MNVTENTKTFKNQDQRDRSRFSPRGFYHYLIHPTHLKRFLFFLFLDFAIIVFSLYLSFFIRFEFTIPSEYRVLLLDVIPIFLLVKLTSFYCFKVYRITWGYVGINDLINIAVAQIASISMLMILILIPLPVVFNPTFAIRGVDKPLSQ